MPFSADLRIGVPSLPAIVEALADGRYDVVHLCSPGPAGIAAGLTARAMGLPVVASHHTELAAYAAARTRDPRLELGTTMALAGFYGAADRVLSPSPASDARLARLGIAPERIGRWDRGVDRSRFTPERRDDGRMPGEITVLYAGRLTREKGADLLADAYLAARRLDPRLHLALPGDAPMRRTSPSGPGDVASSVVMSGADREPAGGDFAGDATRRTFLANERTQLAWWRTGLTSVAVGVGIGRVLPELGAGDHWAYAAIGVGYIVYGVVFVLVGTWRQRQVEQAVLAAGWRAQDRAILLTMTLAGVALALATAAMVVIDA